MRTLKKYKMTLMKVIILNKGMNENKDVRNRFNIRILVDSGMKIHQWYLLICLLEISASRQLYPNMHTRKDYFVWYNTSCLDSRYTSRTCENNDDVFDNYTCTVTDKGNWTGVFTLVGCFNDNKLYISS